MNPFDHMYRPTLPVIIVLLALLLLFWPALAHETDTTTGEPGFRPASEHSAAFIADLEDATISVLPTIVRRLDRSACSFTSQAQVIAYLNEHGFGTAARRSLRVDLGPARRPSQWEMFQHAARTITEKLAERPSNTDYTLVMEILVPGDSAVFGIEVYIVDQLGQHVFSFLLNSHHEMFAEADLYAGGSSEKAREAMIMRATQVGLEALHAQIKLARESLASAPTGGWLKETKIDQTTSRIVVDTRLASGTAAAKSLNLLCVCARLAADRGMPYFRIDEREKLPEGKASFRMRFFEEPPEGFPVMPGTDATDATTATIDAKAMLSGCALREG